jgi:hypothetical protein
MGKLIISGQGFSGINLVDSDQRGNSYGKIRDWGGLHDISLGHRPHKHLQ